jgi:hypothetical protein
MRRRPIGQILVEKNDITEEDLAAALAEQERTGRRLGEILIESGRTSWLALARAIAEQVLDIEGKPSDPAAPAAEPATFQDEPAAPAAMPKPAPVSTKDLPDPALLVRAMAEQVLERHASTSQPARVPVPVPAPKPVAPDPLEDPESRLHSVEALLRERQRAFIELFTTAETLRMKVARLEEILDDRDRELTRLRVLRAS